MVACKAVEGGERAACQGVGGQVAWLGTARHATSGAGVVLVWCSCGK